MSSAWLSWSLRVGAVVLVAALIAGLVGAYVSVANADARTLLTRAELVSPVSPTGPVDEGAFAMPADAEPPVHQFRGTLQLHDEATTGGYTAIVGSGDSASEHLPAMSVQLVQSGTWLIPTRQGLQITGNPAWNVIVGPGRVWQEPGDLGLTRATFPFTLVERNQNCTHNGVMALLFDDHQVSYVRYQVTQETCLYRKFDMWGQLPATYRPQTVANADQVRARMASWLSGRIPTRPIESLAHDYPDAGIDLSALGSGVTTAYGVYFRGIDYVAGCATRYGIYAYCDQMRLPSYSTAKSTFAALAAMRLGQLFGADRIQGLKIADLVPEHLLGDRWDDVTLKNALDMATGHYISSLDQVDESSPPEERFLSAEPYSEKIATAFGGFPYREPPGRRWVYQSHDTFIATRAMTNFIGQDLFAYMRRSVYQPAGMSEGFMQTLRTDNSPNGQPMGYNGLFYNRDDIAKLIRLITDDHGRLAGRQLLDPSMLDAALQRTPEHGLPTETGFFYNTGFWAKHITPTEFPQYNCSFWVPFMSGYGGITVAMLPNGATYWYFSDNNNFSWYDAAYQAAKLAPVC
jgi:hypothetical protein